MRNALLRNADRRLRDFLDRFGYVLMRKTNPNYYLGRRLKLMRSYDIDLVLDVGANTGQYGKRLRQMRYGGEIVSFEPMKSAYQELACLCKSDPLWTSRDFALGANEEEAHIHISGNSVSSSILEMLAEHETHAPASHVVAQESITVKRLDDLAEWTEWSSCRSIWLKIDVQGYEHQVLAGASRCLTSISAIQLELSLRPLYSGQLTITPMMEMLSSAGFEPVAFEPGFSDANTGEYLQVDGIFRNRKLCS